MTNHLRRSRPRPAGCTIRRLSRRPISALNSAVNVDTAFIITGLLRSVSIKRSPVKATRNTLDQSRRQSILMNHTETYILISHCQRFSRKNFSEMLAYCAREAGLARKELGSIQEVTQTHIANNREVSVANMQMESERQIEDVQAVPGETYPDFTRIA